MPMPLTRRNLLAALMHQQHDPHCRNRSRREPAKAAAPRNLLKVEHPPETADDDRCLHRRVADRLQVWGIGELGRWEGGKLKLEI